MTTESLFHPEWPLTGIYMGHKYLHTLSIPRSPSYTSPRFHLVINIPIGISKFLSVKTYYQLLLSEHRTTSPAISPPIQTEQFKTLYVYSSKVEHTAGEIVRSSHSCLPVASIPC